MANASQFKPGQSGNPNVMQEESFQYELVPRP